MTDTRNSLFNAIGEREEHTVAQLFDASTPEIVQSAQSDIHHALASLSECREQIASRCLGEPSSDFRSELRTLYDGIGGLIAMMDIAALHTKRR